MPDVVDRTHRDPKLPREFALALVRVADVAHLLDGELRIAARRATRHLHSWSLQDTGIVTYLPSTISVTPFQSISSTNTMRFSRSSAACSIVGLSFVMLRLQVVIQTWLAKRRGGGRCAAVATTVRLGNDVAPADASGAHRVVNPSRATT